MPLGETARRWLAPRRVIGTAGVMALLVRLAAGAVFVAFGVGKFIDHGSELASFRTYGLPLPAVFVATIGVIEIVGGVLLIVGSATTIASLVLAGDMLGAILVSGIGQGEQISLTLAPALFVAMLFLLRTGAGYLALENRDHRWEASSSPESDVVTASMGSASTPRHKRSPPNA